VGKLNIWTHINLFVQFFSLFNASYFINGLMGDVVLKNSSTCALSRTHDYLGSVVLLVTKC
jgi:hypothetical protein